MPWVTLAAIDCSQNWQFTSPAAFTYCRVRVTSSPVWGRGLIAQVSATDPRDFYQFKRLYGSESEVIKMDCPDCFQGLQSIAVKQYQGYFWSLLIEVWQ
jgi:hypothetical protein